MENNYYSNYFLYLNFLFIGHLSVGYKLDGWQGEMFGVIWLKERTTFVFRNYKSIWVKRLLVNFITLFYPYK